GDARLGGLGGVRWAVGVTRGVPGLRETVLAVVNGEWRAVAAPLLTVRGRGVLAVVGARAVVGPGGRALPGCCAGRRRQA
ncbi:hypothetical protein, partial [Neokomagataea anthophila]